VSDDEQRQRDEVLEDAAEDLQIDDKAAADVKGGLAYKQVAPVPTGWDTQTNKEV
jgi:hypothetical protein